MRREKLFIAHGWLRVIFFAVFFYLILTLCYNFSFLIVNWLQGEANSVTQWWFFALINSLSSFLCVWIFRKFVDKKAFLSLGFTWRNASKHAYTGLLLGIVILGIGTLFLMLMNYLIYINFIFDVRQLLLSVVMMALIALSEELVFRGYILNNLMQSMNRWLALTISSFLFFLAHINNPSIDNTILPMVELFVGGILLGINYIYTKNLWFGIMLHFSWNFLQGPVLGYKVSGIDIEPLLKQNIEGSAIWTGGDFGFEGSLLSIILSIIFIIILTTLFKRDASLKDS